MKTNKKINKSYTLSENTINRLKEFKQESTFDEAFTDLLDEMEYLKANAKGETKIRLFIKELIRKKEKINITVNTVRKLTGCFAPTVKAVFMKLENKINSHNKNVK